MEVYVDGADGKAIAVKNNENNDLNIIIIFSTIEKDIPFEVYRKNGKIWEWHMYDFLTAPAPEDIQDLMNQAERILSYGQKKTIFELPKNVDRFLKNYSLD